jgi:hypothetical protein
MSVIQRAQLQAFISKRWVFKTFCFVVAIPLVLGAFAPVAKIASNMYR